MLFSKTNAQVKERVKEIREEERQRQRVKTILLSKITVQQCWQTYNNFMI